MSPELKELLAELKIDPQEARPQTPPAEAGLDSLALAELSVLVTERGTQLALEELAAVTTVEALDRLVVHRLAGR